MHAPASERLTVRYAKLAADTLAGVRASRPRVHCITNAVAQNFTANVLLAAGAVPSMTVAPEEVAGFVAGADALLVNLGTFDAERREAVETAIAEAAKTSSSWVLDPVFVDRSVPRARFAKALLAQNPSVVRLNAAEFLALADAQANEERLKRFARDHRCVIALTGAVDVITDGNRIASVANGDPLMARVTAMGCAGTAVVAACLAAETDPWLATLAGLVAFAVAGECAAARAHGPGSLAVEMMDALASLDRETLLMRARVT